MDMPVATLPTAGDHCGAHAASDGQRPGLIVRKFRPDDLRRIELQPSQRWMAALARSPEYAMAMESADSLTAEADGTVLAVCGIIAAWPGRSILCMLISHLIRPHQMVRLHRAASRGLALIPGRVEATVDGEFGPGHRWLRMLGFTLETPGGMRGYRPGGGTSYLYARVRQ